MELRPSVIGPEQFMDDIMLELSNDGDRDDCPEEKDLAGNITTMVSSEQSDWETHRDAIE